MAAACGLVRTIRRSIADRAYDAHQHDVILDKAASLSFHPATIADISTLTTKSLIGTAGASKAFSPNQAGRRIATRYDKLAATFFL